MQVTAPLTIAQELETMKSRHRNVTSFRHKRPHEMLDSNAVAAT